MQDTKEDGGGFRMLTINVGVLLAIIVVMRLRRRTQARSRVEERNTALFVLALGIVIAPTPLGQSIFNMIKQLASDISQAAGA